MTFEQFLLKLVEITRAQERRVLAVDIEPDTGGKLKLSFRFY